MITKKTTFVLGAGASMAYGFPSGKTLKALIWKKLISGYLPPYFFEAAGININAVTVGEESPKDTYESKIREFRNLLKLSPDETIDYFLEHIGDGDNKNEYRKIGRLAIAYVLLEREQENSLFDNWMEYFSLEKEVEQKDFLENRNNRIRPKDGHWCQLLFNQMCRDCSTIDHFSENKISIVTFNYDRSFEYYFLCALKAKYKVDEKKAAEIFNQFQIVHVYGQLGELPQLIHEKEEIRKQKSVQYGALSVEKHKRASNLRNSADGIKLIWDSEGVTRNTQSAHNLIHTENNNVVFLGFGYDPVNLKRIMPCKEIFEEEKIQVSGTTLGLSKQRLDSLTLDYKVKHYIDGRIGEIDHPLFYINDKSHFPEDCNIYDFLYDSTGLLE